jgi:hypothetical protein
MKSQQVLTDVLALVILVLMALLLIVSVARAQSGSDYDLSWWTVDGGGGTSSTGGGYALGGTAGQPDVGASLTGGGYTLIGGFWRGGPALGQHIYLPLVLRNA